LLFFVAVVDGVDFLTALFSFLFFGDSGTVRGWPEDRVLFATELSNGLAPGCFVPRGGDGSGDGALSLDALASSALRCLFCLL
jgi:hypothetical protein